LAGWQTFVNSPSRPAARLDDHLAVTDSEFQAAASSFAATRRGAHFEWRVASHFSGWRLYQITTTWAPSSIKSNWPAMRAPLRVAV